MAKKKMPIPYLDVTKDVSYDVRVPVNNPYNYGGFNTPEELEKWRKRTRGK